MHKVLIASNNAHKLQELTEIFTLAGTGDAIRLVTPRELGLSLDPDETADTYLGNAQIKARAFALGSRGFAPGSWGFAQGTSGVVRPNSQDQSGFYVLADDSGLEVDALGGRPGVLSARYSKAAPGGDGCAALLAELHDVPEDKRAARFRCVITLIAPDGDEHSFDGICEGAIGRQKRGEGGFGFDPVFVPLGETRHLAELAPDEKHRISHRGIAARKVLALLL